MRPEKYVLEPAYLVSLFQLRRLKEAVSLHSVGATMENLNTGILARIRLPLPSLHEQVEILNHIGSENIRIEALITAYKRQIILLQEYRASLIHECVTGQRPVAS